MHIPDDPLYYEKFYFTPGDLGFLNFDTKYARIGVQICWDQWYPEGSRLTAMQGAQLIFYPTSIGWHPHEKGAVGAAQTGFVEDDSEGARDCEWMFVAVVNRVGYEGRPEKGDPGIEFWGNSFVADPAGQLLAEGSNDKEEILVAEIEPKKSEEQRRIGRFFGTDGLMRLGVDSEVAGRRVRKDGKEFNAEVAESAEYAEKKTARVKRRDWVRLIGRAHPQVSFGGGVR